jgi:hypothetical protein
MMQSKNNIRSIIIDQKGRKTINKHKSIKSIRARQYTKPDIKRMRNTPSANTKNHTTMFFGYWRTTQRLERCEHLEYLQKMRQTPTRKLQASITNISHLQNTGTHHLQTSPKAPGEK